MVTWLYIDMNSYFASVEQEVKPELRNKPVGIIPLDADTTSLIAASYEAKAFGVKTGTMVRDAKRMCPGIHLVEADHELYIRYHHRIIKAVETCLPIESICSIDEIACRLTGSQQTVEAATRLAQQIKAAIRRDVGPSLRCSIGVATNRYLAKVAGDMQKPDGFTILRKSDLPHALYKLTLRDLPGIGPRMEVHLNDRNIRTMEKLCSLTEAQLQQAWGSVVGNHFWKYLRGEEVPEEASETQSISQSHVLPPELRNEAGGLKVLKKLTAKAALRLRQKRLYASKVGIQVTFRESLGTQKAGWGKGHWNEKTGVIESQDTPTLVHAAQTLWKNIPPGTPHGVGVVLSGLVPDSFHTPSLFENPKKANLSNLMDHINDRFGKELLHYGATHDAEEIAPLRIAFTNIPKLPFEKDPDEN